MCSSDLSYGGERTAHLDVDGQKAVHRPAGGLTAFVLDGIAAVTFIEEVGIVAGTADQDIVADAAVEVVVTVFTNQTVIAGQAVQVVVAGVTVDVVVQSVTGTVEISGILQEQVFNVVGQGVVDYCTDSINTAV